MSHLSGMKNWTTGRMPRPVIMRKSRAPIPSVKKTNSVTCDVLRLWANGMSLLKNQLISWQWIAIISIKMGWSYWLMIKQRQGSVRQQSWQQWLLGIEKIGRISNKTWNISQQESFWDSRTTVDGHFMISGTVYVWSESPTQMTPTPNSKTW